MNFLDDSSFEDGTDFLLIQRSSLTGSALRMKKKKSNRSDQDGLFEPRASLPYTSREFKLMPSVSKNNLPSKKLQPFRSKISNFSGKKSLVSNVSHKSYTIELLDRRRSQLSNKELVKDPSHPLSRAPSTKSRSRVGFQLGVKHQKSETGNLLRPSPSINSIRGNTLDWNIMPSMLSNSQCPDSEACRPIDTQQDVGELLRGDTGFQRFIKDSEIDSSRIKIND